MRVGLVGCVKDKQPVAAPAADLYVSPLFVGRRRYVEQSCDRWFILSALHGFVDPDAVVEPYDQSLVEAAVGERRAWSQRVLASIDQMLGDIRGMVFEVHAGAAYRDHGLIDGLAQRGATVEIPAEGLSQGRQLAFYANPAGQRRSVASRSAAHPDSVQGGSRPTGYGPLAEILNSAADGVVHLTFAELEQLLGRSLPASARRHRPWWGNHEGSPQARTWLGAGWRVSAVDLAGEQVTFDRTGGQ